MAKNVVVETAQMRNSEIELQQSEIVFNSLCVCVYECVCRLALCLGIQVL